MPALRNNAFPSTYLANRAGSATITPTDAVEAGSFASLTLVYTAGYFGIDDTGSLKIVHRFASDMGRMQVDDPAGWNYVSAEASNGAVLEMRYDQKGHLRPWDKTLLIRVQRGFLREGETITVRLGDRRGGSTGLRMQTFSEASFEFKVLVDPFATYNYIELPEQPSIPVVAGPPVGYKAIVPTLRRIGQPFSAGFKGEDKWGNPSDQVKGIFTIRANLPVKGLPATFEMAGGELARSFDGLQIESARLDGSRAVGLPAERSGSTSAELRLEVLDAGGRTLCRSNPMQIVKEAALLPWWADLHGQSEETIGTNSAREMIVFARDVAFLDAMSHQGNDFQITTPFWEDLNRLSAEYDRDGEFVIFPGYEWSGNTGLGGDRNVLFLEEGRQIHRSHHALVEDLSDVKTDANSAQALFEALADENCVVFAHVGGRYADIRISHDGRIERSIEIHSDWGTFEWLLEDAFDHGYRVGIVANSDGHKGRHGASHPGASLFGAYGGLTCLLAPELTRASIADAMRKRHHYATTGSRAFLEVEARFDREVERFDEDPKLGCAATQPVRRAMMGDIVKNDGGEFVFAVEIAAGAPIERIELRDRTTVLERIRPYDAADLGSRIRLIWEGSEYRGRGRQTIWDGSATLDGNRFTRVAPINLWNIDKKLEQASESALRWKAVTTGGFGGADLMLADPGAGDLTIDTALVKVRLPVASIGLEDQVLESGGGIRRRMRVFRLPDENPHENFRFERTLRFDADVDHAIHVCVTFEDGHLAWSSPIYLIP